MPKEENKIITKEPPKDKGVGLEIAGKKNKNKGPRMKPKPT